MKVLIVGGVAGGASAAARLRRLDEEAEIVLFEKGEYISYANCGLPYYIGGIIKDKDKLVVTPVEKMQGFFNIDVRTRSEVTAIDREKKEVEVKNHATGETYRERYDKLVLSPGAEPKWPNAGWKSLPGVFSLRTIPDTYRISDYIGARGAKRAAVVGAGFIGVEMAENLKERGLDVTVVEFLDQAVAPFDRDMAAILHGHMRDNGIRLVFGVGVQGIEEDGGELKLTLSDGSALEADMAVLSIGVAPESRIAKEAGLETGIGGAIMVDTDFATSDPDIYAVGDAIQVRDFVTRGETLVPLAGPANKQGRAVAEVIAGRRTPAQTVQGSSVIKVFDMTAACTGLNEKQLRKKGMEYLKTYAHPAGHAGYYPGSTPIHMKLLFNKEGQILGAQAVGFEGVEKRIDVIATAQRLGGTVYDLEQLELCYAPPYSSAKDPVNMLGMTAANMLRGDVKVVYWHDVDRLVGEGAQIVHVGTPEEHLVGAIGNAVNIPLPVLRDNLDKIDRTRPVYLYCKVGLRGYIAARILAQRGYDVYNVSGGYTTYNIMRREARQAAGGGAARADGEKQELPFQTVNGGAEEADEATAALTVDACGLQCPGPILKTAEAMKGLKPGGKLVVTATDPGYASDIEVWAERTGNALEGVTQQKGVYTVTLRKGAGDAGTVQIAPGGQNDKTMVVFSGDLDKAIASFIIANGAAAMGRKVTMFFTFWGLNILRKSSKVRVKKPFISRMFGAMMPRGSRKLGLSRMNMAGMGARMIRGVMKSRNVQSLEELIKAAMDSGVRVVACQMSMDVMGITPEELIDGVDIGGVATFLGAAELSDTTLFI
jgi:NADPH-dependent 2,4-dienoyl-CoA reductase/sulfur reductase-like enzyme/peroxiredoxin family protein/TusA-related sulfurtransferase/rhodanese-related sulfurtransferase